MTNFVSLIAWVRFTYFDIRIQFPSIIERKIEKKRILNIESLYKNYLFNVVLRVSHLFAMVNCNCTVTAPINYFETGLFYSYYIIYGSHM